MLRSVALVALATLTLGSMGCTTALKQGYYALRGAEGKFYELQPVSSPELATYQAVRVEPFGNDLGAHVPREVVDEINTRAPEELMEDLLFYPAGKTLVVRGRIIHYSGRSGATGAAMSVVSGAEECICRVQLIDGDSGRQLGEAVCWGSVKSALRRGASEFGEGVGRGVSKWIETRLPEEELRKRREELTPKKE